MSRKAILLGFVVMCFGAGSVEADPKADTVTAFRKGQAELKARRFERAIAHYERAVRLGKHAFGAKSLELSTVYNDLAMAHSGAGQHGQAIEAFERALAIREGELPANDSRLSSTNYGLGRAYFALGKYDPAEKYLTRAVSIDEAIHKGRPHQDVATSLSGLSALYFETGRFREALPVMERTLAIYQQTVPKNHPFLAAALNNLANLHNILDRPDKAEPLLEQALEIEKANHVKDHPQLAAVMKNLGQVYADQGKYVEAREMLEAALEMRRRLYPKGHPDVASSCNSLGLLFSSTIEYDKAEDAYRAALAIDQKFFGKKHPHFATTLHNLGSCYFAQGEYARAESLFQQAHGIFEGAFGRKHDKVAASLGKLGELSWVRGQYAKAEKLFQESIEIKKLIYPKGSISLGQTLTGLAILRVSQRDYDKAEPLFREALAINERLGAEHNPNLAATLNNLGELHRVRGRYALAEPLFDRALKIRTRTLSKDHPDIGMTRQSLGWVLSDRGRYAEAARQFQQALGLFENAYGSAHPTVAHALSSLVDTSMKQRQYPSATRYQSRLQENVRTFLLRELPSLSPLEQRAFLGTRAQSRFHKALSVGYQRRDDGAVVSASSSWLLNGKALSFEAQSIRSRLEREITDAKGREQLLLLRALRAQIGSLALRTGTADQRKKLEAKRVALEKALAQKSATAKKLANPWVELDEVRRRIPAKGVLIDIAKFTPARFGVGPGKKQWNDEPRYVAWVIPPTGKIRIVDLGEAKRIDKAIAEVRKDIDEASLRLFDEKKGNVIVRKAEDEEKVEAETRKKLDALAKLVWAPLGEHVKGVERVILSPDGDLWLVPWGALPRGKNRYLVEDFVLQFVVSGRDLVEPRSKAKTGPTTIFADPDFDAKLAKGGDVIERRLSRESMKLPKAKRLVGTRQEAVAAKTLLGVWQKPPVAFLGAEATEARVKAMRSPRMLLLMTHGFFFPKQRVPLRKSNLLVADSRALRAVVDVKGEVVEDPLLRCGLLLAGANNRAALRVTLEDGILTGAEIVGLDLRGTELVVLSACETGLGDTDTGDGVAGLRQAFHLAGAESVLATLWRISDRETVALMGSFFSDLSKAKDRAEALSLAQRRFIAERRDVYGAAHPYFWAAFGITGK